MNNQSLCDKCYEPEDSALHDEQCFLPDAKSGLHDHHPFTRGGPLMEQTTTAPCPHCGRQEPDGTWFTPCPSDDCPGHDRVVYRVEFWVEADVFRYDAYLTPAEADAVVARLDKEEDLVDLYVWQPTAIVDGPDELFIAINDEVNLFNEEDES